MGRAESCERDDTRSKTRDWKNHLASQHLCVQRFGFGARAAEQGGDPRFDVMRVRAERRAQCRDIGCSQRQRLAGLAAAQPIDDLGVTAERVIAVVTVYRADAVAEDEPVVAEADGDTEGDVRSQVVALALGTTL